MKRYILLLIALLTVSLSAPAADRTPIDPYRLPKNSQQFLRKNFIYAVPVDAVKHKTGFEVLMNDNTTVDFDRKGAWSGVACAEGVPETVVPFGIRYYVIKRFEGQTITRITRSRTGYRIELTNGLALTFDTKCRFLKVD